MKSPEIRDLTSKTVEEARKAFESFIAAAQKAAAQAEGTANSCNRAPRTSAEALNFTEANVKAAFDHAQKLIRRKDPQEIVAHQTEFVKSSSPLGRAAKELGAAVLKKVTPIVDACITKDTPWNSAQCSCHGYAICRL